MLKRLAAHNTAALHYRADNTPAESRNRFTFIQLGLSEIKRTCKRKI